jgi:SagB-type dehydrogenase family enzyme
VIHAYHDGTKHAFERFARSLGYLDWASQPHPFRSFSGAREIALPPRPDAAASEQASARVTAASIGDILRHSLGLSAWKEFGRSRWSLRVNPSSGNLHPTEAYVVCGPAEQIASSAGVYHYAADRHALEARATFDTGAWRAAFEADPWREPFSADVSSNASPGDDVWFVVLTSIHWREAWKYGERAFRYCQHDLGHAIAAISIASALAGWRATIAGEWSHREIAALVGIDRDEDFVDAEREEPECLLVIRPSAPTGRLKPATTTLEGGRRDVQSNPDALVGAVRVSTGETSDVVSGFSRTANADALLRAVRAAEWTGRASQLSEDHVEWTFIDEIARATEDPGRARPSGENARDGAPARLPNRALLLQRRSALALDGRSSIDAGRFIDMLAHVMPGERTPWDAIWWDARIHLALFVHRVDGVDPGLYLLVRHPRALEPLQRALTRDFSWTLASDRVPLFQLARGDCRRLAQRLSCDQEIAGDGFFSLGMIAEFDASLAEFGPAFYRHLFWESGIVGQVLYLEAEAAGARATGIGCFFDDPVHHVLGIADHSFQSLYHFTIGMPVEDQRLTSEPGYTWERAGS